MSEARCAPGARLLPEAHERELDTQASDVFGALYEAAFPRVYSMVRCQVATTEAAQEIVSRVFLKAYQHRGKIPEGDGAMFWIFRIAQTTIIDYWRVEGRRERANVPVEELSSFASTDRSPESDYQGRQRVSDLLQIVSDLPDDHRKMLALKFAADRTNREIASILNISEAAVSMRLLRALQGLRERLKSIGWHEGR